MFYGEVTFPTDASNALHIKKICKKKAKERDREIEIYRENK